MVKNGRPEPKRPKRGGKGGRTPGRVQVYNNNKKWQVPSPATDPPLPPAPLFSPLGLVKLAGIVLLGFLMPRNGPKNNGGEPRGPSLTLPLGPYVSTGASVYVTEMAYDKPGTLDDLNWREINPYDSGEVYTGGTGPVYGVGRMVAGPAINTGSYIPGGDPLSYQPGFVGTEWLLYDPDGEPMGSIPSGYAVGGGVSPNGSYWWRITRFQVYIRDDGREIPLPTEPEPLPLVPMPVPIRPLIAPPQIAPLEVPEVLPLAPPNLPTAPPVAPPTEAPRDRPVRPRQPRPGRNPVQPVPQTPNNLAPIQPGPDGTPQPLPVPLAPVPITPPDQVLVPGGVVGKPGQPPAPNLQSIAKELGRLEGKAEMGLGQGQNMGQQLDEILRRLNGDDNGGGEPPEPYQFPSGQFELWPVCGSGAGSGEAQPLVAQWPGGVGEVLEVRRMVEALALLIQYHKELRQPVCKLKPIGESVTVNFIEQP